jgi:hypothetical protein
MNSKSQNEVIDVGHIFVVVNHIASFPSKEGAEKFAKALHHYLADYNEVNNEQLDWQTAISEIAILSAPLSKES